MMRYVYLIGCLAGLLLICAWAGTAAADRNFSQHPGFAEYFAANLRPTPPVRPIRPWPTATRRASTFPPATKVPSTSTATTSPTVT